MTVRCGKCKTPLIKGRDGAYFCAICEPWPNKRLSEAIKSLEENVANLKLLWKVIEK